MSDPNPEQFDSLVPQFELSDLAELYRKYNEDKSNWFQMPPPITVHGTPVSKEPYAYPNFSDYLIKHEKISTFELVTFLEKVRPMQLLITPLDKVNMIDLPYEAYEVLLRYSGGDPGTFDGSVTCDLVFYSNSNEVIIQDCKIIPSTENLQQGTIHATEKIMTEIAKSISAVNTQQKEDVRVIIKNVRIQNLPS